MALFGFGKKKKDPEASVQSRVEDIAPVVQKPRTAPTSVVRKASAPASSAARPSTRVLPGAVRHPSVAVRPKPADSARTLVARAVAEASSTSQRKIRASTKNKQVGQLLLAAGKISKENLEKALTAQDARGGLLGQILTQMGYCIKADVAAALKKQRTITTVDLTTAKFDADALKLLTREFCEKNKLIAFELVGTQLFLSMSNALDTLAKNEVKNITQMHIKIFDSSNDDIQKAIARYYGGNPADAVADAQPSTNLAEEARIEESGGGDDMVIELPEYEDDSAEDHENRALSSLPELAVVQEEPELVEPEALPEQEVEDIEEIEEISHEELLRELRARKKPAGDVCHAGNIPSVGDIPTGSFRPVCAVEPLNAIPLSTPLAHSIISGNKVDLVKLWVEEKSNKEPVPAALSLTAASVNEL